MFSQDIAVEETSNAIYWTDNLQKRILWRSLADPDSETQTLFQFSEEKPTGITVDNCARYGKEMDKEIHFETLSSCNWISIFRHDIQLMWIPNYLCLQLPFIPGKNNIKK